MIMTGVSFIMLILVFFARFPEANLNYKFSVGFKLLTQAPVIIAAIAMMCSIGLDNAFKQWIPQVLQGMGAAAKQASLSISLFGLAMMSGRFIFSTIKNMTAISARIIIIAAGSFAIIFYILTISNSVTIGYFLSVLAGLAAAPMFPSIVGMTFSKYDRKYYGSIFGMIFAIGLFFAGLLMQVIGNVANKSSVQAGLKIPIVIALVMILVTIVLNKAKAKPLNE
jgi:predicted MFS family arabinose efflux permease